MSNEICLILVSETQILNKPVEVRIPFPGFYNTLLGSLIDDFERGEVEFYARGHGVDYERLHDFVEAGEEAVSRNPCLDYKAATLALAVTYVEMFVARLAKLTGVAIRYKFKELESPRYYNYRNDQAYLDVELSDLLEIQKKVPREDLDAMAKRLFTSYDGFISYYDPNVDSWGPSTDWDHNQWFCVLVATQALRPKFKWRNSDWYYYDLDANEILGRHMDCDKFFAIMERVAKELGIESAPITEQGDNNGKTHCTTH